MSKKIINQNKGGLFNYEVIETYQAGIVLTGPEVKSVKGGQIG
ncbi:SsrA-binding protein, partial [Candidatus Falkowbacteria bacterium]|nr:SsrA-binding protein [Candidatus Falkowbacteria bacterium]